MTLCLSNRDLELLQGVQDALLSPLDHPDVASWARAVIHGLTDVLGTDRITMVIASGAGLVQQSHPVLEPFHDAIAGMVRPGPTGVAFRAEQLDQAFRARRRRGWNVWSNRMLEEASGTSMPDLDFFHEVVVPAGVAAGGGLTVDLPDGEALIATGPGRWPDEQWLHVLRLLVPSLRAGAAAATALGSNGDATAAVLEGISDGAAVLDEHGRIRYRNPALAAMLQEHRVDSLHDEIQRTAAPLLPRLARRGGHELSAATREVVLEGVVYVLRPARLPAGAVLPGRPAVLVVVERCTPRLPSARALTARFGLTGREAEVALLLARGLTNRAVAERLGISGSTVRTHTEHIFDKLAIRTRKALALRLLGGHAPG